MVVSDMSDRSNLSEGATHAKRRVLLVLENLPVPHDRRMWQVATSLRRAGYHVSVISPRPPDEPEYCELEGIHLYRYPMLPPTHSVGNFIREALYCLWHTFRLSRRVEKEQGFDVFHAGNPLDIFWSIGLYYKLRGKKFVYEHRDLCPELYEVRFKKRGLFYQLQVWFERLSYRFADMIIEMNESYRQNALQRGRARPDKIVIVRSGPRMSEFYPVEPDPSLKCGKRYLVCYLGVMGPQDGTDIFVKAAHHIVRQRGFTDVHFVAIGSGDCLEEVKQLTQALGMQDYITFTGFIRERELLIRYLSTADVGVASDPDNSYTARSTMNKIIEFMAVGLPIVATRSIENKWSAQDALISPPDDSPEAFGDTILALLHDEARRKQMSEFGRKRFLECLSWERSEQVLLCAYDRLFHNLPPNGEAKAELPATHHTPR
jgi:glycosyltransferase involved in cell wall biosynthesis